MWRLLRKIMGEEHATATTEWLLVTGVSVLFAWVVQRAAIVLISHIFTRTAMIIASPIG